MHLVVGRPRVFSIRTLFCRSIFSLNSRPVSYFHCLAFFTSYFVSISDHALSNTVSAEGEFVI